MANGPSETQLSGFLTKLRDFRETLPADDQKLLDSMYETAMGASDHEVKPYWVVVTPRPVVVTAPVGWGASPWGARAVRMW